MKITVDIELDNLVGAIVQNWDKDQIFEYIRRLDLWVAEYDFTKRLKDHFVAEMEKEEKHES